jgi:23S rRNA (cytosine1962-C5)-methyltransferase
MQLDHLDLIPPIGERRLAVRVKPSVEPIIRGGHPWLYEQAITNISHQGSAGDIAIVFDRKKRFLAAGLYDPDSPIRVRLLVHGQPEKIARPLFARRLAAAQKIRTTLIKTGTDGYRLIHGANDGLPGMVVDRYGQTYVLKLYSAAWIPHLKDFLAELTVRTDPERVVLRLSRQLQERRDGLFSLADGQVLLGSPLSSPVQFNENGLLFEADVIHGQKTGFFLDQRENRQQVGDLAAGKSVLNVFAYSGGFSLYAARGGAVFVTDVDQSMPALNAARRHFDLNSHIPGVSSCRRNAVAGDVFQVLPEMAASGRLYDIVVLDPPAFARRKKQVAGALRSYGRLARLGLAVLRPGGILVASSCSSRVTDTMFFKTVNEAACSVRRPLRELARTGHALDHPIGFKEGAYLKTLFAEAP